MKIAISTDGNNVSAHFGRCPQFTVVDINNNNVLKKETLNNPGHSPGSLPDLFHNMGVNCIIAGGMGRRAIGFFNEKGIQTILGINATIDDTIKQILSGTLKDRESLCNPGAGKGYGIPKTHHNNKEEN